VARRVRPRIGLARQGTLFWRAGDPLPSAETTDGGASIVLEMSCHAEAAAKTTVSQPLARQEAAAAEREPQQQTGGGAAVVEGPGEMEDEEYMYDGAPRAFIWYVTFGCVACRTASPPFVF
jgi:hypothetical protein